MKKIIVRKPGGYSRLELISAPDPCPGPGEVLVETASVGVNFADVVVRLGLYPAAKKYVGWPITPGFEFAGRVAGLGVGVEGLRLGDEVLGGVRFGAYATHVVVPHRYLFLRPPSVPLSAAGGAVVAPLTAWYALVELGAARSGKKVLVHSAAGGVGGYLVQMARGLGCEVTAVVSGAKKVQAAMGHGAEIVIDKEEGGWADRARAAAPLGYDIVLDANGYETLRASYTLLRPTGRLVIYGAHSMMSRGRARASLWKLLWGYLRTPRYHPLQLTNDNKSVLAFNLSYLFDEVETLERGMNQVLAWFAEGLVVPPPLSLYPFEDAAQAHEALQSGRSVGKIVLHTSKTAALSSSSEP